MGVEVHAQLLHTGGTPLAAAFAAAPLSARFEPPAPPLPNVFGRGFECSLRYNPHLYALPEIIDRQRLRDCDDEGTSDSTREGERETDALQSSSSSGPRLHKGVVILPQ